MSHIKLPLSVLVGLLTASSAVAVVLAPAGAVAATSTDSSSGSLLAGGFASRQVDALPGLLSATVTCSAPGAKVAVVIQDSAGTAIGRKTTARCAKSDETATATVAVNGGHTVVLREKKDVPTPYALTITYESATGSTLPGQTTTSMISPPTFPATTLATTTTTRVPRQPLVTAQCTGSGDETAFLQDSIDGTADGGRLRVRGTCSVASQLWLFDRRNITVEGVDNATIDARTAVSADVRHLRIQSGSGITLRNLTILGARTGCSEGCGSAMLDRQHGIAIESRAGNPVSGVLLDNITISGVHGDFLYLGTKGSDTQADLPRGIEIRNSRFSNSGRQGIAIAGGSDVLIKDNRLESAGRSTFDFEAEAGGASAIDIVGNEIFDYDNSVLNVGCADRGDGGLLNRGPITLRDNTTHGQDFKVATSCDEVDANISVDATNRRVD